MTGVQTQDSQLTTTMRILFLLYANMHMSVFMYATIYYIVI